MEAAITLSDQSGVGDARRQAIHMSKLLGLSEKRQADAALVVTEAATNILKYAGSGKVLLRSCAAADAAGLEILALDKGPGIADLSMAKSDGYSTGGSLGAGLGTILRHSAAFDIYSLPDAGTALVSQIMPDNRPVPAPPFVVGSLSTPKPGQEVCGDAWATRSVGGRLWVTLLDGLGHGPLAAEAARGAIMGFNGGRIDDTPSDVLKRAHETAKSTRGAVMAVAMFDANNATMQFAGIGNIVAIVAGGGETEHLLSMDGTVGYNMRVVRQTDSVWRLGRVFIATTDGLSTRWNLNKHPGLMLKHPSLIAAVLHRDFSRDSDDASIIVVKAN